MTLSRTLLAWVQAAPAPTAARLTTLFESEPRYSAFFHGGADTRRLIPAERVADLILALATIDPETARHFVENKYVQQRLCAIHDSDAVSTSPPVEPCTLTPAWWADANDDLIEGHLLVGGAWRHARYTSMLSFEHGFSFSPLGLFRYGIWLAGSTLSDTNIYTEIRWTILRDTIRLQLQLDAGWRSITVAQGGKVRLLGHRRDGILYLPTNIIDMCRHLQTPLVKLQAQLNALFVHTTDDAIAHVVQSMEHFDGSIEGVELRHPPVVKTLAELDLRCHVCTTLCTLLNGGDLNHVKPWLRDAIDCPPPLAATWLLRITDGDAEARRRWRSWMELCASLTNTHFMSVPECMLEPMAEIVILSLLCGSDGWRHLHPWLVRVPKEALRKYVERIRGVASITYNLPIHNMAAFLTMGRLGMCTTTSHPVYYAAQLLHGPTKMMYATAQLYASGFATPSMEFWEDLTVMESWRHAALDPGEGVWNEAVTRTWPSAWHKLTPLPLGAPWTQVSQPEIFPVGEYVAPCVSLRWGELGPRNMTAYALYMFRARPVPWTCPEMDVGTWLVQLQLPSEKRVDRREVGECPLCCETSVPLFSGSCSHAACAACWRHHFRDANVDAAPCAHRSPQCPVRFSWLSQVPFHPIALQQHLCLALPSVFPCHCGSISIEGRACMDCSNGHCSCGLQWHPKWTCIDAWSLTELLRTLLKEEMPWVETGRGAAPLSLRASLAKRCPRCRRVTVRNEGCFSMKCLCGYSYCFHCLGAAHAHFNGRACGNPEQWSDEDTVPVAGLSVSQRQIVQTLMGCAKGALPWQMWNVADRCRAHLRQLGWVPTEGASMIGTGISQLPIPTDMYPLLTPFMRQADPQRRYMLPHALLYPRSEVRMPITEAQRPWVRHNSLMWMSMRSSTSDLAKKFHSARNSKAGDDLLLLFTGSVPTLTFRSSVHAAEETGGSHVRVWTGGAMIVASARHATSSFRWSTERLEAQELSELWMLQRQWRVVSSVGGPPAFPLRGQMSQASVSASLASAREWGTLARAQSWEQGWLAASPIEYATRIAASDRWLLQLPELNGRPHLGIVMVQRAESEAWFSVRFEAGGEVSAWSWEDGSVLEAESWDALRGQLVTGHPYVMWLREYVHQPLDDGGRRKRALPVAGEEEGAEEDQGDEVVELQPSPWMSTRETRPRTQPEP